MRNGLSRANSSAEARRSSTDGPKGCLFAQKGITSRSWHWRRRDETSRSLGYPTERYNRLFPNCSAMSSSDSFNARTAKTTVPRRQSAALIRAAGRARRNPKAGDRPRGPALSAQEQESCARAGDRQAFRDGARRRVLKRRTEEASKFVPLRGLCLESTVRSPEHAPRHCAHRSRSMAQASFYRRGCPGGVGMNETRAGTASAGGSCAPR